MAQNNKHLLSCGFIKSEIWEGVGQEFLGGGIFHELVVKTLSGTWVFLEMDCS